MVEYRPMETLEPDSLELLHRRLAACRLCEEAGYIEQAAPVFSGLAGNRMMLIGQAPGITERQVRRPFNGRAGRELFRWMDSIGISEVEFRHNVYMSAITKCYPGRATSGSGDRRPSAPEIALCKPWLDGQLALVRPDVILPVGTLAIERYFQKIPLKDLIGRRFERDGIAVVPLPHPSGASRWLNRPEHRALLAEALALVRVEWDRVVAPRMVEALRAL